MRKHFAGFLSGFVFAFAAIAETASATDPVKISVDTRTGELRTAALGKIGYSPAWCGVETNGAYAVVEKIANAGKSTAVTSVVAVCSADAEAYVAFTPAADDPARLRFVHRVYDSENVELGVPLERDVVFGAASSASAAFAADCRAESFAELIATNGTVAFTYSSDWTSGVAKVSLTAVKMTDGRGEIVSPVTQELFFAGADAAGVFSKSGFKSGGWRVFCTLENAAGESRLEYFVDYFKKEKGFSLIVR